MGDSNEEAEKIRKRTAEAVRMLRRETDDGQVPLQKLVEDGEIEITGQTHFGSKRGADALNEMKRLIAQICSDGIGREGGHASYPKASKKMSSKTLEIDEEGREKLAVAARREDEGLIREEKTGLPEEEKEEDPTPTTQEPVEQYTHDTGPKAPYISYDETLPDVIRGYKLDDEFKSSEDVLLQIENAVEHSRGKQLEELLADLGVDVDGTPGTVFDAFRYDLDDIEQYEDVLESIDPALAAAYTQISDYIHEAAETYEEIEKELEEMENRLKKLFFGDEMEAEKERQADLLRQVDDYMDTLGWLRDYAEETMATAEEALPSEETLELFYFTDRDTDFHVFVVPDGMGRVTQYLDEAVGDAWKWDEHSERSRYERYIQYKGFDLPDNVETQVLDNCSYLQETLDIPVSIRRMELEM